MRRKKARQIETFDGIQARFPPQWSGKKRNRDTEHLDTATGLPHTTASSDRPKEQIRKRTRIFDTPDQILMGAFYQSIKEHLIEKIARLLLYKKKLATLKETLLKKKMLPPGIITRAEEIACCAPNELKAFLDDPQRNPVRNVVRFTDFVEKEFDNTVIEQSSTSDALLHASGIRVEMQGGVTTGIVSQRSVSDIEMQEGSAMDTESVATKIELMDMPDLPYASSTEADEIRTVTVTLKSILHRDLGDTMKKEVVKKLNGCLYDTSDFISDYGLVVQALMLSMRDKEFVKVNNNISMQKCQGFMISSLFPMNFNARAAIGFTATAIPEYILNSEVLREDFKSLFQDNHLSFIFSAFFGRGNKQETMNDHPLMSVMNEDVKEYLSSVLQNNKDVPNSVKRNALVKYMTNMANIWSGRSLANRLMDKLLEVLLKIHLAPRREQKYRELVEKKRMEKEALKKKKEDPVHENALWNMSRNQKRDIIRSETYKKKKYQLKCESNETPPDMRQKWFYRYKCSEARINSFKSKMEEVAKQKQIWRENKERETKQEEMTGHTEPLSTFTDAAAEDLDALPLDEQLQNEDLLGSDGSDTSRRRLGQLKAVMKNVMYKYQGQSQNLTIDHFLHTDQRMTAQEVEVCLVLARIIIPYLPSKENHFFIGHQLPFVLFANDVLRYAGYSKFCRSFCPLSSPTDLQALNMDSVSIYALFSRSKDNAITLFDFEGYPIPSEAEARTRKDAVFHSFFDLNEIRKVCAERKLEFGHYITILPGLKLVRILGTKRSKTVAITRSSSKDNKYRDLPWGAIHQLQCKSDEVLKAEIADIEEAVTDLVKRLRGSYTSSKGNDYSKLIMQAKAKWNKGVLTETQAYENHVLYLEINKLKKEKYAVQRNIQLLKKSISRARYERFVRNKAITLRASIPNTTGSQPHLISKNERYIGKCEDMRLSIEGSNTEDFTFSGTDNGIVTMTETVGFCVNRFKYHLELHNRYSPLVTEAEMARVENEPTPQFLPLPDSLKINSGDIDFGGGHWRQRKRLEKKKKLSAEGRQVMVIEEALSRASRESSGSKEDILAVHQFKKQNKDTLRKFYHSNRRANLKKIVMLRDKRFRDRLCSRERKYAKGEDKKSLVMFIGDRGTGVGSRIKGHRRYGGKWKPVIHGRDATVCITNEHKTSQTCVYCFWPVIHPQQRLVLNKKEVLKECRGAFQCINPSCVSVKNKRSVQSRDQVSAMAIGLSGLATVLFQETFPVFSPKIVSQCNTDYIKFTTDSFLTVSESRAAAKL